MIGFIGFFLHKSICACATLRTILISDAYPSKLLSFRKVVFVKIFIWNIFEIINCLKFSWVTIITYGIRIAAICVSRQESPIHSHAGQRHLWAASVCGYCKRLAIYLRKWYIIRFLVILCSEVNNEISNSSLLRSSKVSRFLIFLLALKNHKIRSSCSWLFENYCYRWVLFKPK